MPIGLDLEPGIHTILVTYPRLGNKVYPANTQINVEPNTRYQVIYIHSRLQSLPLPKFPSELCNEHIDTTTPVTRL